MAYGMKVDVKPEPMPKTEAPMSMAEMRKAAAKKALEKKKKQAEGASQPSEGSASE